MVVVIVLVAADQVAKLLIMRHFKTGQSIHVVNDVLDFTYVQNRGAAFGIFSHHRWIFMVLTSLIMVGIVWLWVKEYINHITGRISAVLIMAGGIGNMIDRVRLGYVVDFIDINPLVSFAVFNIADCSVTIGAALLMVYILFYMDEKLLNLSFSFPKLSALAKRLHLPQLSHADKGNDKKD